MRYGLLLFLWMGCWMTAAVPVIAQPSVAGADTTETLDGTTGAWAWRPLVELAGVAFAYLYYSEQRSTIDGVVLKLHNQNDYAVRYRFRAVVRTRTDEYEHPASGTLAPGETVTGDADGLYFTVEEHETIAEIGLRGYRIVPADDVQALYPPNQRAGDGPKGALRPGRTQREKGAMPRSDAACCVGTNGRRLRRHERTTAMDAAG